MPGRYEVTVAEGEQVRAFIPAPLPPRPPLNLEGDLLRSLEAAGLALGRLEGANQLLEPALLVYSYVRKEAVLSSQIEGTQSSLSDLLLFELDQAPGVPRDDAAEVLRYVAAMDHGLRRLAENFPLSNRLIRELHGILLSTGRGASKDPGEFRRSQNWIVGSRPGNAVFVPPPHLAVPDCMAELERFLHAEDDGLPILVRAGLAHVQFETIHPFLDGNGRVGRLLITLLLCEAGVLSQPLLYLSVYFKRHRDRYYELLDRVRQTGDWEAWLTFFLQGVQETAENAAATARRLTERFAADRQRLATEGRKAGSALRVHEALQERPILSIPETRKRTHLAFPTVSAAMRLLEATGLVREITGFSRNRVYVYSEYLRILNEGVEGE